MNGLRQVAPLVLASMTIAAAAGCSARSGYEGLRAGAQNDCALQPPSMYEECMQRTQMDYDEYRQRVAEAESGAREH